MRWRHPFLSLVLCIAPLCNVGAGEPSVLDAALGRLGDSCEEARRSLERGRDLIESGRFGEAVEVLAPAVGLLSQAEPVFASACRLGAEESRAVLAIRSGLEALALRGGALSRLGRGEEARRDLAEWVRLVEHVAHAAGDPGLGLERLGTYDELLRLCAEAGRFEEARTVWERLLRRFRGAPENRILFPCRIVERMAWLSLEAAEAAGSRKDRETWLLLGGSLADHAEELADPRKAGAILLSSAATALRGDPGRALCQAAAAAAACTGSGSGFHLVPGTLPGFLIRLKTHEDGLAAYARLASWMILEGSGEGEEAERERREIRSSGGGLHGIDPSTITAPLAGAFVARALIDQGALDEAARMLVAASLDSRIVLFELFRRYPELEALRGRPALEAQLRRWTPGAEDPWERSTEPMRLVVQRGHALSLRSVDRSADGRYIATVDSSGIAILWNPQGIKLAERNIVGSGERFPEAIRVSPDGSSILTGSSDGITGFPLDGAAPVAFERHRTRPGDAGVRELHYTGDEALVIGFDRQADQAEEDFSLGLWDLSGRLVHRLIGHEDWISAVSSASGCPVIASGDQGGAVRLWDVVTGSEVGRFAPPAAEAGPVQRLDVRADGGGWIVDVAYRSGTGSFPWPSVTEDGPRSGSAPVAEPAPAGFRAAATARGAVIPRPRHVQGTRITPAAGTDRPPEPRVPSAGPGSPDIEVRSDWIVDARISPSGQSIVAAFLQGYIHRMSFDGKLTASRALPPGYVPNVLAYRPGTEELLVTARKEGGSRLLWILGADLSVKHELLGASAVSDADGPAVEGTDSVFEHVPSDHAYFSMDGTCIDWNGSAFRIAADGLHALDSLPDEFAWGLGSLEELILQDYAKALPLTEDAVSYGGGTTLALHEGDGRLFAAAEPPERANTGRPTPVLLLRSDGGSDAVVVGQLGGLVGGVRRLQFDPTGRYLLACGREPFLRLYNVETGAAVNIVSRGRDWIAYTDDGLFDASNGGGRLVAVVQGLTAYGIDQFAASRNRPDLIFQRMQLGTPEEVAHYRSQHQRRLQRLGIGESDASSVTSLPQARIAGLSVRGREATLQIEFRSAGAELLSYQLYVNDVPLFPGAGKPLAGTAASVEERIELGGGGNKIEAGVFSRQGAESIRARTLVSSAPAAGRDLYYLGFGVSDYRDDTLDLGYAARDAADLAATLRAMEGRAFRRVVTRVFTDGEVTPGVVAEAGSLFSRAGVDDVVVVFASGHGVHDRDGAATYYYLAYGTETDRLAETAIRFEGIEATLAATSARNKLLLLDTCESGELLPGDLERYLDASLSAGLATRGLRVTRTEAGRNGERGPARSYLLDRDRFIYNDVTRRTGAIVFSSCRGGELSYEDARLENGLFTESLLNAFRLGDTDGDDTVTTDELRAVVPLWVAEATGGLQNPTVDRDNLSARIAFPRLEGEAGSR